MASRFFTIGALTVLSTMAAVATVSTLRQPHLRPSVAPGTAHLLAFGRRSAQQQRSAAGAKFDGALGGLTRHAGLPIRWLALACLVPRRARTSRSRDRGLAVARARDAIQADISGRHAARAHRCGNSGRPRAVEGGAGLAGFATSGGLLERCRRLAAGGATRRGSRA